MDTSEFDSRIAEAEERIAAARSGMLAASSSFASAVATELMRWYPVQAERAILRNAERAKQLGIEGLRSVKVELEELRGRVPELVQRHITEGVEWAHGSAGFKDRGRYASNSYAKHGSATPDAFKKPLAAVFGELGPVLVRHGLSTEQDWRALGVMPYPSATSPAWTDEMEAASADYASIYESFVTAVRERDKVLNARTEAEAKDLWGQV